MYTKFKVNEDANNEGVHSLCEKVHSYCEDLAEVEHALEEVLLKVEESLAAYGAKNLHDTALKITELSNGVASLYQDGEVFSKT